MWSRFDLHEFQMQELRKLLHHAYKHVPYYRHLFDKYGIIPSDIKTLGDFARVPTLTKNIIREEIDNLVADNFSAKQRVYLSTSGSTGDPMGFYLQKGFSYLRERAFIYSLWDRVGYNIGDPIIKLRGDVIPHKMLKTGKFWKYNPWTNTLILSSYHLNEKNINQYKTIIEDFRPKFLHVYPSTATLFTKYLIKQQVTLSHEIKAILCGSENIFPWQRTLMEDYFQSKIFSWYGHSEMCVLAGECEVNTAYHCFPEYGITEFVPPGHPSQIHSEYREIIATGFNNYAMPLIRYKTGDICQVADSKCTCGRNYDLIKKIEGRTQELIQLIDGTYLSLTSIAGLHIKEFSKILQMQFIQREKGRLQLNIIKGVNFDKNDEKNIVNNLVNATDSRLDISINYVRKFQKSGRRKQQLLIQEIPLDN